MIGLDLHGLYDAERAAKHREQIRLAEEQRAVKRELFHELPVDERVKRLVDANRKHGNVIREEIRSLERHLSRLEERALRIDDTRGTIDACGSTRVGSRNGSMTCTCERCEPEREDRVRRGVHGRIADAAPLRAVRRPKPRRARVPREYEVPPEFEAKYGT